MELTPQSFADCNSREQLYELWETLLDMLFDDENMTQELTDQLFEAYKAATLRLSKPQAGVSLVIPTYLIINEN